MEIDFGNSTNNKVSRNKNTGTDIADTLNDTPNNETIYDYPYIGGISDTLTNRNHPITEIDLYSEIGELLEIEKLLEIYGESIALMDLANMCSRQCFYCYLDSLSPKKIDNPRLISADSWLKLLKDDRFILLLNEYLRIGHSGDICDHPDIMKILQDTLQYLPNMRLEIRTNYRSRDKELLKKIVKLVRKHGNRVLLVITVNWMNKKAFFRDCDYIGVKDEYEISEEEYPRHTYPIGVQNITNKHGRHMIKSGRLIGKIHTISKLGIEDTLLPENEGYYDDNVGECFPYLNPHGLLVGRYVKLGSSSNTGIQYIEVKKSNFIDLSGIPLNKDIYPTYPHDFFPYQWPGGKFYRPG